MKYSISLLLLFITLTGICAEVITGRVVKVADGDTFTILTEENTQLRVRLHGVDCPEKKQDFGTKAMQFTSDLIFAKTVKIEVKDIDRYGRTIGVVELPDGRILNKELLKAGLAWHYKHYDKSREFAILEQQAMEKKLGMWSSSASVAPWIFRKSERTK